MDAVARGMELMKTPVRDLPPAAWAYANFLFRKVGACGEVFLTAYAHYAQVAEGLTCGDDLYRIDEELRRWYGEATATAPEPAIVETKYEDTLALEESEYY